MKANITDIKGIGPSAAKILNDHGFTTPAALADASIAEIVAVPGFSEVRAATVKEAAALLLSGSAAIEETVADEVASAVVADSGSKEDKKKGKAKGKKKDKKKGKDKGKKKK